MIYQKGECDKDKCLDILNYGFSILDNAGLIPFFGTVDAWMTISGTLVPYDFKVTYDEERIADWDKWHLVIDGKKYYSKFKNLDDWADYYSNY